MKQNELHQLIMQHIPQITHLETDTSELAEGECTLWGQDDCTIMLEFADRKSDCHTLVAALQKASAKLRELDAQREHITQTIQAADKNANTANAYVVYVAFLIENASEVFCDFAVSAPTWGERVAEWSLEDDDELIFNGFE